MKNYWLERRNKKETKTKSTIFALLLKKIHQRHRLKKLP